MYGDLVDFLTQRIHQQPRNSESVFSLRNWWKHRRSARGLYDRIEDHGCSKVIAKIQTTNTWAFVKLPVGWIYDQTLIVFASDQDVLFAILQSTFHEVWALRYGSTLKTDLTYSPTKVFTNFPLPDDLDSIEHIGTEYHKYRCQLMLNRREGLTEVYNRFHNTDEATADTEHLRRLHNEMNQAIAAAYGWDDLDLGHGFHETSQGVRFTISEPARVEVLERLLELNHQRYEEEVKAGLHDKKKSKKKSRTSDNEPELF